MRHLELWWVRDRRTEKDGFGLLTELADASYESELRDEHSVQNQEEWREKDGVPSQLSSDC